MFTHTSVLVTDTLMLTHLGPSSLATAGLGSTIFSVLFAFIWGASIGIQIIVARRYGERNYQAVANVFKLSLWVSIFFGSFVSLILWHLSDYIVPFFAAGRPFGEDTISFLQIRLIGLTPYFLLFVVRALFDGIGKTYVSFIGACIIMCANIFLNWVLIYGNLGFQAYGTDGAAAASSLAVLPGLFTALIFILNKNNRSFLKGSKAKIIPLLREIIYVGLPSSLDTSLMYLSFSFFYRLSAMIDTETAATTNVLLSINSLAFMPCIGFAIAATTILGQAVAVEKYHKAYVSVKCAAAYCCKIMAGIGFLFILCASPLLYWFANGNPTIMKEAYPALLLLVFMQIADGYHMILGAALRSAGFMYWLLAMYATSSFLIMLPSAYVLGVLLQWESLGLWAGMTIWSLMLWILFHYKFEGRSWQGRMV